MFVILKNPNKSIVKKQEGAEHTALMGPVCNTKVKEV